MKAFPVDHLLPNSRCQSLKLLLTPQPPKLPWWPRMLGWLERALWL